MASTSGRMLQELPHHQTLQLLVLDVRGGLVSGVPMPFAFQQAAAVNESRQQP